MDLLLDQECKLVGKYIKIARVNGVHGIRGQIKIESFTDPSSALLDYINNKAIYWNYPHGIWEPVPFKKNSIKTLGTEGRYFVINIVGCTDRDEARKYQFTELAISKADLPVLNKGQYYWADLEGLNVYSIYSEVNNKIQNKQYLGVIEQIIATGSNDVLVVKSKDIKNKEHLIPYLLGKYVLSVDLSQQEMIVDWDPEF